MTSLIKLADLPASTPVLPLEPVAGARSPMRGETGRVQMREPVLSSHDLEIARLRDALASADQKLDLLVAAAREQGRKEALEAVAHEEAKAQAALTAGIAEAVTLVRSKSEALESLALAVAEHALANVFANPKTYRPLVTDAILRQVREIRRETVLAVHVSPADFSDAAALGELARGLGHAEIRLLHDRTLAQGACRIDLRLGQIELSLPQYWDALRARLAELATANGGSR